MSWRPTTFCPACGDPHDVWTEGLCGPCQDVADALEIQVERLLRAGVPKDEVYEKLSTDNG